MESNRSALNIGANRAVRNYSRKEQLLRILWAIFSIVLFRCTIRPMHRWRCAVLRLFGASIGRQTHIYESVKTSLPWNLDVGDQSAIGPRVQLYNLGKLTIGSRVTISQGAHLCGGSHDFRDPTMPLIRAPITIENDAWVCADSFVGPGVRIGRGAVVGARAVVTKDVDAWSIVAGNPAVVVGLRTINDPSNQVATP